MKFVDILMTIVVVASLIGLFSFPGTGRKRTRMVKGLVDKLFRSETEEALPEFLDRISSDISAGRSLQQSLESVAREPNFPLNRIIHEVFDLMRANLSLTEALEKTAMGCGSPPLRMALVSIALSIRSGSNLINALQILSKVCRDRERVRQRIRSQSAQARAQGGILILVPLLFLIALAIVSPRSLQIVVSTPIGKGVLALAALFHVTGTVFIIRMVRPERW